MFESGSERDSELFLESGSQYLGSGSQYLGSEPDLGLYVSDFDAPPTDSMTEELSAFELLVTIENERKRQARIAEDALPAADSVKVPRKYCPCSAWRD